MNKKHTEYIALYLFVFGAILLFGVLARKFLLVKGYDEFSASVGFFATVVVLSALYISLQITLNELLLPRMEKFIMRFPAFQKLEEVVVVTEATAIVAEPTEYVAIKMRLPHSQLSMRFCVPTLLPSKSEHHKRDWSVYLTTPSRRWLRI